MKGKPHQKFKTSSSETLGGFLAGVLEAMEYDDTQCYRYLFGPKSMDGSFVAEERSETLGEMGVAKDSMFRILYDPDGDDVTEIICTVEGEEEGEPIPERRCILGGEPRTTRTQKVGGEGKIFKQYGGDDELPDSDDDENEDEDGSGSEDDEYSSSEDDDSRSIDLDSEDDISEEEDEYEGSEDDQDEDEDEEDDEEEDDDDDAAAGGSEPSDDDDDL